MEALHAPRRRVRPQLRIHEVNTKVLFERFCGCSATCLWPLQAPVGRLPSLEAHSSLRSLNNSLSGHSQITQGKQHDQLRHVLAQPFVAHLSETELALDDSKRAGQCGASV